MNRSGLIASDRLTRLIVGTLFTGMLLANFGYGRQYGQEGAETTMDTLKKVHVNGAELHYLERGEGVPVIFIHGGLADYQEWGAQLEPLSEAYRVILYSRRYAYPNDNPDIRRDHSARTEAEDLAALIRELELGPAHVAGLSYGAYTALFLAVLHPELVRTLILAEAPVLGWLDDLPGGAALLEEFTTTLLEPVAQAFRQGDKERALRISIDVFFGEGALEQLPEDVRGIIMAQLRRNLRDWEAQLTSEDGLPQLAPEDVERLTVPTLMISGGNTLDIHKLVDAELERLIPNVERMVIPDASHEICNEFPEHCTERIRAFLAQH
jgi:pimeloyl-ACP methyl ester carboxylesterase